jgi:hypothetical protein
MTESPRRNLGSQVSKRANSKQVDQHFADEAILVDGPALLALGVDGRFGPHLLDIFQHHVAVAIEGLDAGEQLSVVAAGDQDLGVVADGGLQDGKWAGGELMLLQKGNLVFPNRQ